MARRTANFRKYLKQRRAGVAIVQHRRMMYEAHRRVQSQATIVDNVWGYNLNDTTSSFANLRRKLLGLGECSVQSSREEILQRLNRLADRTEVVHSERNKALFLIRTDDGYFYFIYRDDELHKKSAYYSSRTAALERYRGKYPGITWLKISK